MKKSRTTYQKEIIEKQINKTETFFSAEDLFKKITKKEPKIGIATIYRYLKEQTKKQKLFTYTCDRKIIYSKAKKSHCHFICEKTGKIIHFEINNINFLKNKIPGTIKSFSLEVRGICEKCKTKTL